MILKLFANEQIRMKIEENKMILKPKNAQKFLSEETFFQLNPSKTTTVNE